MLSKSAAALLHLAMFAGVCAIAAYWAIRIMTPAPIAAAPLRSAAAVREADPLLAARMFGLVQAAPVQSALSVQPFGVFAAGRDSAAVLAIDGKPPRVFLLEQEVGGGARLVEVRKDAVTIEQGGARRDYAMPVQEVAGLGGSPPPAGFSKEGMTLTAPTVAGAAQPAGSPARPPLPPRPGTQPPPPANPQPVPQAAVQPQSFQPTPHAVENDESSEASSSRRARPARPLNQ